MLYNLHTWNYNQLLFIFVFLFLIPDKCMPSAKVYGPYVKISIIPNSNDGFFLKSICFSRRALNYKIEYKMRFWILLHYHVKNKIYKNKLNNETNLVNANNTPIPADAKNMRQKLFMPWRTVFDESGSL